MIDNLLRYPQSCIYGKTIPKATFYKFLDVSPAMQRHFQNDVASIMWLYKISPDTLQVRKTETVKEIEIFLADLKIRECDTNLFTFIDKNINKHIVFILHYEGQYRLLINYKQWADTAQTRFDITQTFLSEWLTTDQLSLSVQGNELSAIYEGFVRQIAGKRLNGTETLQEAVLSFQKQQAIEKQIAQLQKLVNNATQPHRKFALHQQIIQLKQQLNN